MLYIWGTVKRNIFALQTAFFLAGRGNLLNLRKKIIFQLFPDQFAISFFHIYEYERRAFFQKPCKFDFMDFDTLANNISFDILNAFYLFGCFLFFCF